ncbi:NAD-dependent epimerase/dehydratase family protein [Sphingomonas immobilis]|uniref:NAD(P)H-binding protein n=1 Tax=Sphingomonas immobilis TaxID=3063997 RepID=A0ABT8ZXM4_9SPHN|nr:NAD-dependent epimerase/dehydratase family protein [Sphingomonas sp. CA1-15]MDO7842322.1 NAD(P)H-binding protein [Sphingomonas sp. CA1-15]
MKIFVIGGTGLIGGHAARAMAAAGHEVSSLARSDASEEKLKATGIAPIRGDAEDRDALARGIADAETVVFAPSMGDAETAVVDWMLDHMSASGKSLIFCSGTGVLGQRTGGAWSEDTFAETDEFVPQRAISTRWALEGRVRSAAAKGLKRGIVVRPPAVWTHDQPHALVTDVLGSVRKTGAACYIGEGLNMYTHIHGEDLGEAFRHVAEAGQDRAVYHAVAGEVPNRWIAETVARLTGAPTRSITMDEAIALWGKFATLIVFGVSSRSRSPRTRREFGWSPKHTDMLAAAEQSIKQLLAADPL